MVNQLKSVVINVLKIIFYRNRLDSKGNAFKPKGLDKIVSETNQFIIEKSCTPPWIWNADACGCWSNLAFAECLHCLALAMPSSLTA